MTTPDDAVGALAHAVGAGDRTALARALTLVESRRPDHRDAAADLLRRLPTGGDAARRIGITGVPGVGKSTFIDTLGVELVQSGHRVAVLAVDPSSARSGGSILGDRTRMHCLAPLDEAFVRPSPSAGTLGGVARATRESIALVEAAGFDVVLVETVGVGQSEYLVADMVDTFCLLTLARTGDELQGIKRGILELADVIAVNKADGKHLRDAESAAGDLRTAMRLLRGDEPPTVVTCSALTGAGVDDVWAAAEAHHVRLAGAGLLARRREQDVRWAHAVVRERLLAPLDEPSWREQAAAVDDRLRRGELSVQEAAAALLTSLSGWPRVD